MGIHRRRPLKEVFARAVYDFSGPGDLQKMVLLRNDGSLTRHRLSLLQPLLDLQKVTRRCRGDGDSRMRAAHCTMLVVLRYMFSLLFYIVVELFVALHQILQITRIGRHLEDFVYIFGVARVVAVFGINCFTSDGILGPMVLFVPFLIDFI